MSEAGELPKWAAVLTAMLLLLGSATTLIGALGLLRLGSFYERVHAPTLGTTLGTGCLVAASMICFSALETQLVLHPILITIFVTVTTPITLMVLVRAALFRDRSENADGIPRNYRPLRIRRAFWNSGPPRGLPAAWSSDGRHGQDIQVQGAQCLLGHAPEQHFEQPRATMSSDH